MAPLHVEYYFRFRLPWGGCFVSFCCSVMFSANLAVEGMGKGAREKHDEYDLLESRLLVQVLIIGDRWC